MWSTIGQQLYISTLVGPRRIHFVRNWLESFRQMFGVSAGGTGLVTEEEKAYFVTMIALISLPAT